MPGISRKSEMEEEEKFIAADNFTYNRETRLITCSLPVTVDKDVLIVQLILLSLALINAGIFVWHSVEDGHFLNIKSMLLLVQYAALARAHIIIIWLINLILVVVKFCWRCCQSY